MSESVLDEVIRQCTVGDMTARQLQDAIKTISSYLRDGPAIAQLSQDYFKEQIKRVEDVIVSKTKGVGRRIDELEKMIITTNDRQNFNAE